METTSKKAAITKLYFKRLLGSSHRADNKAISGYAEVLARALSSRLWKTKPPGAI